jgi:hypothetical protein
MFSGSGGGYIILYNTFPKTKQQSHFYFTISFFKYKNKKQTFTFKNQVNND